MSNNQPPRITKELIEYLESVTDIRVVTLQADSLLDLGRIQGEQGIINHLRFVKVQQEKESLTNVSTST